MNSVMHLGPWQRHKLAVVTLLLISFFPQYAGAHDGDHSAIIGEHFHLPFHIHTNNDVGCKTVIHHFNPLIHKPTYRVGVYASEGDAVARGMYSQVFDQYLTATAGRRFDPPIQFELVPVSLTSLMELSAEEEVDFLFASSAVFSCMATEYKAQPLATITNRRTSRGHTYDLDMYGGVMFTMADRHDIETIHDFKGKIIGAGAITAMGGGQTQFYEMVKAGLSFVSDPKQVIFTGDERLVVQGLLDGDFEIAFARTDQIERHTDENGDFLHEDTFKIINAKTHIMDDGKIFPFVSSTSLHPEWPVGALDHTDKLVAKEVQEALLALSDHAMALDLNETLRCDTTLDLAVLAKEASISGAFTNFRTPRSYFEVRTKQERAGFLREDGLTRDLHCIRGDTLYHDIDCPDHYYKVTEEEFERSCELAGLECKEGYECYCKPCIKAFEVDVFQYNHYEDDSSTTISTTSTNDALATTTTNQGCEKMSRCGYVQQTKEITFRILDNLKRDNPYIEVIIHLSDRDDVLQAYNIHNHTNTETNNSTIVSSTRGSSLYTYEFQWTSERVGVGIMEVFVDGVQIPESPLRVQVVERRCDVDYEGQGKVANSNGDCVCPNNTYDIGNKCVDNAIFAIIGSVVGVVLLAVGTFIYLRYKAKKSDQLWHVHPEELHFDDPVEIIGEGAFGQVLLAEYRGTKVAVKRAVRVTRGGSSRGSRSRSRQGASNAKKKRDDKKSSITTKSGSPLGGTTVEETGVIQVQGGTSDSSEQSPTTDDSVEIDLEAPSQRDSVGQSRDSLGVSGKGATSTPRHFSIGFLKEGGIGARRASIFPFGRRQHGLHESILGSISASAATTNLGDFCCPWFTESARLREEFRNEMRVLAQLRHPCITTVMGAVIMPNQDPVMVMEFMEYGSLHQLLRNETMSLDGEIILQICRDLAQGLRYLHSSKPPILHGDLKARNILVDSRFRAKLCDFGLSTKRSGSVSGTPFWLAPEYLTGAKKYDTACDMYSVGIILYEIYSRKSPYHGEDYKEVIRGICNRRINKRPDIPAVTPPKFVDLMKKCWSPDVAYRPQARNLDVMLMEMDDDDAEPLKEEQMLANKKRSGDLLYEIFPKHVADALKNGQKVEPEKHEMVTVIFSDIVKFTDISRQLPPEKVCDMLDRLYVAFDACSRKHQVFKVETIGDAWMGVTNLENDQGSTHAKNIAEMAIDMIKEASSILIDKDNPSRGRVNIRVGFHSGPVVSNVIGTLNKRYCLFGDTVNTASRMESNSSTNRILCSEVSYKLLKDQAPEIKTKSGGKIQVKGKGDMAVFWVGSGMRRSRSNESCTASHHSSQRWFPEQKTVAFAMDEPSESHGDTSQGLGIDDSNSFKNTGDSSNEGFESAVQDILAVTQGLE